MADQKPLISMKKTFSYKFIPSKAEEEACEVNNTPWGVTRELIGIRDIYPALIIDLKNPRKIKKKITHDEVVRGKLVIPFFETFEYILRYWNLSTAQSLVNMYGLCVDVWDVTEENDPKKYEGGSVFFMKLCDDNYSLSCIKLFNDRRLSVGDEIGLYVGDEIGLYWDPRNSSFMFKLLSKVNV